MTALAILLISVRRINFKENGAILLEIHPDTISEILYHCLALTTILLLAVNGELVMELLKTIAIAYLVSKHGNIEDM